MRAVMQPAARGRKHRCAECGVAFYDMERELSACPKCETPYGAAAQMPRGEAPRKRQSWNKRTRPTEPVVAAEAPAADDGDGVPILDAPDGEPAEDADENADDEEKTETGDEEP